MKVLARTRFASFGVTVPPQWKDPQGDAADMYGNAFKTDEKVTAPGDSPLFRPASMNKYHTDVHKQHAAGIGSYLDGITGAICSAWDQWQKGATLAGVVINGASASGGQLTGPPLTPLILASAPKDSPQKAKYSNIVATVIGNAWLTFTATVKVPALPWYPAYAVVAAPVAPPTANTPVPFAALTQMPISIMAATMKPQMVGMLGDPTAPHHKELFESICDAFEKSYNTWKTTTMVTNVLPTAAPVPSFAPPAVPAGPVVGGVANMTPGGLT
jgi:hypothetical protein